MPDPQTFRTGAARLAAPLFSLGLAFGPTGLAAGEPPVMAQGGAPVPGALPSNVWEEGGLAEARARAEKRALVLVATRTEAERDAVLAHLSTLEGAEWRSRAEFWLPRPGDAQAAACLDLNQVRSLPALLVMEVGKTRSLKGVRMGPEAMPWATALSHLLKDEAPLTAEAVQAWAGKGVDAAPFLAFAKARAASLSAGLQEPHQRWLRALAAKSPQPVKHWAVTRLFEAGALEARDGVDPWMLYAAIREEAFRKEVLKGNLKQAPVTTPPALGVTGVIPLEAPCWALVKRELRMAKEVKVGTSIYALMAPVLEVSDRDWVLGQARLFPASETRQAETYALYWMVVDWLICFGNAQDWDTFQASVTQVWKGPLAAIRKQLEQIPAYWAVSAELQALLCGTGNPEAFWRNPDPCLEAIGATREHLVQLGMQSMKVRRQPTPPPYPEVARRNHLSGTLQLRILADAQGKVHRVRPLPGYGLWALGPYGLEYASRWAFEPAWVAGKPIPAAFWLTMPFMLQSYVVQ